MSRPNTFIVGAPKCGSTALHAYLASHPNVFMSEPKEPLYWADDFPLLNRYSYLPLKSLQDYLALFAQAGPQHTVIGEASTAYLLSRNAVPRIHAFNPQAKYLVLVRNPVDLVHSLHTQLIFDGFEDVGDIREAWALQAVRQRGERIPPKSLLPELLQYEQVGKLGEQLQRLYSVVPREQAFVMVYDDLAKDPRGVYLAVEAFLGLPDDGRVDFPAMNASKRMRFRLLSQLAFDPPMLIAPFVRRARRAYETAGPTLKAPLMKLLRPEAKRPPMPAELKAELRTVFRDDVRLLGQLINRDLSHWVAV